ncbi:MAG: endonuclease/exonuclease/phosphatase family protein [Flavobacteriales bacterium]|nr:endonuclease/exonuclease/phosphatase family protein [Bacteroidota bacterium]MCB9241276.1 endonuclease/exonuclease/phosphatase family protein [Flavobacteriales bacterium]
MKKIMRWVVRILNWCVMAGLILGYLSPYINPNTLGFIGFFGLTFQAWAVAGIILVIVSSLLRIPKWYHLAIALVPLLFYAKRIYGFGSTPASASVDLRVVSFNVRGFGAMENTSKSIDSFLLAHRADVAVLIEYRRPQNKMKHKEMPHAAKFMHGVNAGIKVVSRFPIIRSERIELPETEGDAGYADIRLNNDTIRVYALHLESNKLTPTDYHEMKGLELDSSYQERVRDVYDRLLFGMKKQSEQALIVKKHMASSPYPVMLCADLNATPMSFSYQTLKGSMLDAFSMTGSGIGSTYLKPFEVLRIDYILYDRFFTCQLYGDYDGIFSDHKLIFASFSYTPKN